MDFDPRITSDGSGCGAEHGWDCNFHIGHGHDVIYEDVQNAKSCMQALRHLISGADANIQDLEDELAVLRCQLKWGESDNQRDPYEVCCAALRRKIASLLSSIHLSRNTNASSEHAMNEALQKQQPAARISDIINDLISNNFKEPDEEVVSNGNERFMPLETLFIDNDLAEVLAILELSMASEEKKTVLERQGKPERTFSGESSSDAAKYATNDSIQEGTDMGKPGVEVTGEAELDADRCTSGLTSPTHLQVSTTEQQGESEICILGSKIGRSDSSPLSAEVLAMSEEDKIELFLQHVTPDTPYKLQNHEKHNPAEDQLQAPTAAQYGKSGSAPSSLKERAMTEEVFIQSFATDSSLEVQDHKRENPIEDNSQRRFESDIGVLKQSAPRRTLKPFEKIGERMPLPRAETSRKIRIQEKQALFEVSGTTSKFKSDNGVVNESTPKTELNPIDKIGVTKSLLVAENSGQAGVQEKESATQVYGPKSEFEADGVVKQSTPRITIEIEERKCLPSAVNITQVGVQEKQSNSRVSVTKSKFMSDIGVFGQSTPRLTLEPSARIEEKQSLGIVGNSGQVGTQEKQCTFEVSGTKRKDTETGEREIAITQSPVAKVSKGEDPCLTAAKCSDSSNSLVVNLRFQLSTNPRFLNRLRIPELKEIAKQLKLTRISKLKKEDMIERLSNFIRAPP